MADQAGSLCGFVGLPNQSSTALGSRVSLAGFIHAVAGGSWVRGSSGEPGQRVLYSKLSALLCGG